MKGILSKIILICAIGLGAYIAYHFGLFDYLNLDFLKENQAKLQDYYASNKVETLGLFFLIYTLVTALSVPGAAILTLASGALFGFWTALLIVSFASSAGATLAFLSSRFLLRDFVRKKFRKQSKAIDNGVEKDGAFYLFGLRLIPIFPFFAINLAMGLTSLGAFRFYWVSQIGMLPGTAVYVNAGLQLGQIEKFSGVLSPELLFSFALLGAFPLIAKKTLEYMKKKESLQRP